MIAGPLQRRVRVVPPRRDIIREGDTPRFVNVVLEGWAQRYKQLADGRRQTLSLFVPGDVCDANVLFDAEMDHSVASVTKVKLAEIPVSEFKELMEQSCGIRRAVWRNELVTVSIQREWTTNIGRRTAYERIAHLLCELFVRLRAVGLTSESACEFPLTQSDVADATGLTQVHVNRIVQEMRRDGLIELRNRQLTMRDYDRLAAVALFNPNYLHLRRSPATADLTD